MDILKLLESNFEREISEKEYLLELLINSTSLTKIDDCKILLKEIGVAKLALSTLWSMMIPENKEQ